MSPEGHLGYVIGLFALPLAILGLVIRACIRRAPKRTLPPVPSTAPNIPAIPFRPLGRPHGRLGVWILAALALFAVVGAALFFGAAVWTQKPTMLHGRTIAYSLQLPSTWTAKPGSGRNSVYDMLASSGYAYVGIVAGDVLWGTTETVAAAELKHQKTIMSDVQCSDPKPIMIDGRQWLQIMCTGRNEGLPLSSLAYVYTGPEGTFEIIGWAVQSAFDRALPSLRKAMQSFRFPETSVVAVAPSIATASSSSAVSASLVHGYDLDYTLLFPSDWIIKKNVNPNDILANSKSLYVGVIAEDANLGSSAFVQKLAQKNVMDSGATDVSIAESETITIDGRKWLGFVLKCVSTDKVPLAYQFYVYSGAEGTFQLISWTVQNLFERDIDRARSIMQSFTFPVAIAPRAGPSHSSDSSTWKSVSGRELACSIRIPPNWQKKSVSGDFALMVGREAIRVGVIAEEANLGSPEAIAAIARKKAAEEATVFEATEPKPMQIAGKKWLQFVIKRDIDKIPVTYQFYVYAGPEGSYQIIGWTIQNLFARDSSEIRQVMQTFRFPP